MIIRAYSDGDLSSCIEVFIRVFNQAPWNDAWTQQKAEEYLMDAIHTPGFMGYVVQDETMVKGFVFGIRKKWWSGEEFFINEMCVETAHHRSGMGTRLIKAAADHLKARGIKRITLLTNRGTPAEAFYKKNGFHPIEDLVFMVKTIES